MSERPEAQLRTVVRFSGHAVERFRERVRPGLTLEAARADLIRVVESGRLVSQPPRWIQWDERSPLFLELGDVVFPLRTASGEADWEAATCLVRGSLSLEARRRRSRARRQRRRQGAAVSEPALGTVA